MNDTDLIDDTHDITSTTQASFEDISNIKINKYQGLDNFFRKVIDEEKKKSDSIQPEKQKNLPSNDWKSKLFPDKFQEIFSKLNPKNLFTNTETPMIAAMNKLSNIMETTNNENNQIFPMLESKNSSKQGRLKSRRQFNKLFPIKKLKRSESMKKIEKSNLWDDGLATPVNAFKSRFTLFKPPNANRFSNLCDAACEENQPKHPKFQRKLSFKNLDPKDAISFLENLKNSTLESPKEHVLENIKKILEKELEDEEKKSEVFNFKKNDGPWGVPWEQKVSDFKEKSDFGHFPSYQIKNIIIKGGDDLRQELIAMQLIIKFKQFFDEADLKLYLRPYDIMVTSPNSGILG